MFMRLFLMNIWKFNILLFKNFIDIHVLTETRKTCHLVARKGRTVVREEDNCRETPTSQ